MTGLTRDYCFRGFALRQLYFGFVELLLDFGEGFGILFGGNSLVPLLYGTLPVAGGEFQAAGFLVEVAEMFLDSGVGTHVQFSLSQSFLRQIVFAQFEIDPAQRVEIGAVIGLEAVRACLM